MEPKNNKVIIAAVIISFFVGGIMGTITGGLSTEYIIPWFEENILGQTDDLDGNVAGVSEKKETQILSVEEESQTTNVVSKVTPSVGSIIVKQNLDELYDLSSPSIYDRLFGYPSSESLGEQEVSAGTGFIVSSDGYILTNKHVIDVSEAEYTFITNEGLQYDAQLIDVDPFNDVAVMKIDATDLPYVELGDSDSIKIGQTVIAIGNTLSEYPNTVTKGVVSGIGRTITAGNGRGQSETIEEVIQTDAAINPGNSGGPLVNLSGQVVGINTAVNQSGQSIGFALSINFVRPVIESVQKEGRIIRPYLGIRYRIITADLAEVNNLSVDYGALVVRGSADELAIVPGAPADIAGLEENDIILEINGQQINEDNTLSKLMKRFSVGDTITLEVMHDDTTKTVEVLLEEYPDN
ncbi:trypsin-like peptidase domain-containing protein [Patescibacteria group bacterium]|nr:trypsin-like peptidase domain-containing protein [Patescibacteria group bacterium]MBU1890419.1 trypsin-like peptidase domain-containing protein [Patescibacteria group bacterium]